MKHQIEKMCYLPTAMLVLVDANIVSNQSHYLTMAISGHIPSCVEHQYNNLSVSLIVTIGLLSLFALCMIFQFNKYNVIICSITVPCRFKHVKFCATKVFIK